MKPGVAFDVCHEIYVTAREIVNSRMATLQMDRASKFLWRPDLKPRLVEYVADFALVGSRALGEDERRFARGGQAPPGFSYHGLHGERGLLSRGLQVEPTPDDRGGVATDKAARALAARWRTQRRRRELRASRLVLFRVYYLGGAEYHAARRLLGLSETSWAKWAEEIRASVGRELLRAGMFPPSRYFREMSPGK
jgi:hypothetical protein